MAISGRQPMRRMLVAPVIPRVASWLVLCATVWGSSGALAQCSDGAERPWPRGAQINSAADAFDDAHTDFRRGASTSARAKFEAIVQNGMLDRLDSRRQHATLDCLARLAILGDDGVRAHAYAVRSTSLSGAMVGDWFVRFDAARSAQKWDDAMLALTTVARQWPASLGVPDIDYVLSIIEKSKREPRFASVRYTLLRELFDAGWRVKYIGEPNGLWFDLALMHIERGNGVEAATVIRRVTSAEAVIRMRADRRFDSLRDGNPLRFDVMAAVEEELNFAREQVARAPDALEPVNLLAAHLLDVGRHAEALELVDKAISRAAGPTAESKPYTDGGSEFPWLLDAKARALLGLRRFDEAVRQRVRASILQEHGHQNVSQTINLASLYAELHRPVDALKTLRDVGRPSDFGRMQLEGIRLQAAVQIPDQPAIEESLSYLRAHRADALDTLESALMDAGAMEEAADLMIERLADPEWRSDALLSLQTFDRRPDTPSSAERRTRWQRLQTTPRVAAAIERVGRTEHYDLAEW